MPSTGLNGPQALSRDEVTKQVTAGKIGNYALSTSEDVTFTVCYVGRSDDDLLGSYGTRYERIHNCDLEL